MPFDDWANRSRFDLTIPTCSMTCLPIQTRARGSVYPFVVVLQADFAEGETRLIAPLAPHIGPLASAASRALAPGRS